MNYREMTAPCGLDCFNCTMYETHITNEIAAAYANATGMPVEKVPCKGCRSSGGCRLHYTKCDTMDCVKQKRVEFCFECDEFPCSKIQPSREGADKFPHNVKLYNLCRIQRIGIDEWAKEAQLNKDRYFKGRFVPGAGPVLEQK